MTNGADHGKKKGGQKAKPKAPKASMKQRRMVPASLLGKKDR